MVGAVLENRTEGSGGVGSVNAGGKESISTELGVHVVSDLALVGILEGLMEEGIIFGDSVGIAVGCVDGAPVGGSDGKALGRNDGEPVGTSEGPKEGPIDGAALGLELGLAECVCVGDTVGNFVCKSVGASVVGIVGLSVVEMAPFEVGLFVLGDMVGSWVEKVGLSDGCCEGDSEESEFSGALVAILSSGTGEGGAVESVPKGKIPSNR